MDDSAAVLECVETWHETACVEQPSMVGPGTRIGPYAHVMAGATVGAGCRIGRNVVIAPTAAVGDGVTIGHNVVVEDGVVLGEGVVCGAGVVFATVRMPRGKRGTVPDQAIGGQSPFSPTVPDESQGGLSPFSPGQSPFSAQPIVVCRQAALGANATILGGVTVGEYAVVGAGAVVTGDVPSCAVMAGVPARRVKWLCRCGRHSLNLDGRLGSSAACPVCRRSYRLTAGGAEEYSPDEERRRRKAELRDLERRFVASITPGNR